MNAGLVALSRADKVVLTENRVNADKNCDKLWCLADLHIKAQEAAEK